MTRCNEIESGPIKFEFTFYREMIKMMNPKRSLSLIRISSLKGLSSMLSSYREKRWRFPF